MYLLIDEERLSQLLIFITGLDVIPPLGFHPQPALKFGHDDIDDMDPRKEFPISNTCINSLSIPIVSSYERFKSNMNAAIDMSTTFSAM